VAFELVLAYSVSPEAMLGGCDYRQRLFTRNNWGLGPVFGLGGVRLHRHRRAGQDPPRFV